MIRHSNPVSNNTVAITFIILWYRIQYYGWGASFLANPPWGMELDPPEPLLLSCQVGRRQHFPSQYAHACPPASVPPPHSSSRLSTVSFILWFNHHLHIFVVLVVLAFRVSAHRHLPLLCSPRATVSFVPVISSLTIARTFFFYGTRTQPPISAIIFLFLSFYATNLLLISVATASWCRLRCNRVSIPPGRDTISDLL